MIHWFPVKKTYPCTSPDLGVSTVFLFLFPRERARDKIVAVGIKMSMAVEKRSLYKNVQNDLLIGTIFLL